MPTKSRTQHYVFQKGRVPTPNELLQDDKNVAIASGLRELQVSPDMAYVQKVGELYNRLVQAGNLTSQDIPRIIEFARERTESYWKIKVDAPVQVVPGNHVLEAEREYFHRVNREIERGSSSRRMKAPVLPSPGFVDYLDAKLVLSDAYVVLRPRQNQADYPYASIYYTGDAEVHYLRWGEELLKLALINYMTDFTMRKVRGETGENLIRISELSETQINFINFVLVAGNAYALPHQFREGGIPVLFRRIHDVYYRPTNQMVYVAFKALADDMGAEKAILFDNLHITIEVRRAGIGPIIEGYLFGEHPNHEKNYAVIREAVKGLRYPYQRFTIGKN